MNLLSNSVAIRRARFFTFAVVLFLLTNPVWSWTVSTGDRATALLLDAAGNWLHLLGAVMLLAVAGGVAGFFIGTGMGTGLWLYLRKHGWLEAHWRWYRHFHWAWPVLLVASLSLGMAAAGMLSGVGWKLKRAVQHDRLIDRTAMNLYGAMVCLSNPKRLQEHNATALLQQDIDALIAQARVMGEQAQALRATVKKRILDAGATAGVTGVRRLVLSRAIDWLLDEQIQKQLTDKEWGVVILHALGQPGGVALQVSGETMLAPLRKQAVAAIDAIIWPYVFAALAVAFGVPILSVGTFRLLVRITGPPASPAVPPATH